MIMMGPVVDIVATVQNVIDLVMDAAKLGLSSWLLIGGGIIYVVRFISFYIDLLLINFIGAIYDYFTMLLDGTMFNEEVVSAVMKNVYVFIGVIVFFRLVMVLLKYIVNPELVSDGKIGATNLVKRVIIGMAGIILIPTIFTFANNIQVAFLKDQVIQKIIIPEDLIEVSKKKVDNAGRYIGTYVLGGFLNPSSGAPANIVKEYDLAIKKGDLSSIDVNDGALLVWGWGGYKYNYFVFLSTFVLGYVLFLMIKYCLDLISRLFKLFVYRLIAPIAMIEYMINGSDDGVFKNWKTAVLSTYFLLFVRVFALWFVVFVMTLMTGDLPDDKYVTGSLLATNDNLLRALIIVALLGFMMDLPKLIGNIFGLDLEQEGSASGLLNSIKGGFAKIAGAGLTMGGAMVGGAIGAAKGGIGSLNAWGAKKTTNAKNKATMQARADKLGTWSTTGRDSVKAATSGVIGAAMKTNQYTASAYGGYSSVMKEANEAPKKEMEKAKQNERDRNLQRIADKVAPESVSNSNNTSENNVQRGDMELTSMQSSITTSLKNGISLDKVAAEVEATCSKLNVPKDEIEQIIKPLYDTSSTPEEKAVNVVQKLKGLDIGNSEVDVKVNQVAGDKISDTVTSATQTVNQEVGTRVSNVASNATQTVNQTIGQQVSTNAADVHQTVHQDVVRRNHQINDVVINEHRNVETTHTTIEDKVVNDADSSNGEDKYTDDVLKKADKIIKEIQDEGLRREDEQL